MSEIDLPGCEICSGPIYRGQHMSHTATGAVHVGCSFLPVDLEATAAFLERNAETRLCHRCIAAALETSYDEARKAVSILRLRHGYRVEIDHCTRCENKRLTVSLPPPAEPGAEHSAGPRSLPRASAQCLYCSAEIDDDEPWRWVGFPHVGFRVHLGCERAARGAAEPPS